MLCMEALKTFLRNLGTEEARSEFAASCGTSLGHIRNCIGEANREGGKRLNAATCVAIESLSKRAVMRWDMRPDWKQIWPELVSKKRKLDGVSA